MECSLLQIGVHVAHQANASSSLHGRRGVQHGQGGGHAHAPAHLHGGAHAHSTSPATALAQCLHVQWNISTFQYTSATVVGSLAVCALLWRLSAPRQPAPAGPSSREANIQEEATGRRLARKPNILALDGLRLPFICFIAYGHLHNYLFGLGITVWPNGPDKAILVCFFVMSGFVSMYGAGQGRFEEPDSWRVYMARRIARLSPAYYIALFWNYFLTPCSNDACAIDYPLASVFMQAWFPVIMCEGGLTLAYANFPSWFASCIMAYSLVTPWLIRHLQRSSNVYMILTWLVALFAVDWVFCLVLPEGTFIDWFLSVYGRFAQYVAGAVTARFLELLPEHVSSWPGWGWVFDVTLVYALVAQAPWIGQKYFSPLMCLMAIAAACAVRPGKDGRATSGCLGRILSWRPISGLGEYSHAVYHVNTVIRLSTPWPALFPLLPWPVEVAIFFGVCVAAAAAVLRIEKVLEHAVQQRLASKTA